ncbi:hypothetical protein DMC47_30650 [Nostoc sp. 3335mG]|nr:hypothetical protein DMC47_30650 [Nostoc sp. 3335mG]
MTIRGRKSVETAPPTIRTIFERHESDRLAVPAHALVALRESIVTGALVGGSTIRQDKVAQAFETSKAPIREALRELEAEGLVRFERNKGFIVTRMSLAEMQETFQIRQKLEPLAMRLAMPMLTKKDIDRAMIFHHAIEDLDDLSFLCSYNLNFHIATYAPSNARHLLRMVEHSHYVTHRYIHAAYALGHIFPSSDDDHRSIIESCRARNADMACDLIEAHIVSTASDLRTVLQPHLSDTGED